MTAKAHARADQFLLSWPTRITGRPAQVARLSGGFITEAIPSTP